MKMAEFAHSGPDLTSKSHSPFWTVARPLRNPFTAQPIRRLTHLPVIRYTGYRASSPSLLRLFNDIVILNRRTQQLGSLMPKKLSISVDVNSSKDVACIFVQFSGLIYEKY
jgi:hypothetical protein